MAKALMDQNMRVVQIADEPFDVAPEWTWGNIDEPDVVEYGMIGTYVVGTQYTYAFPEPPPKTPEELKAEFILAATTALDASDAMVMGFYEAGSPLPAEWKAYRKQLRALIASGTGSLPSKPTSVPNLD